METLGTLLLNSTSTYTIQAYKIYALSQLLRQQAQSLDMITICTQSCRALRMMNCI